MAASDSTCLAHGKDYIEFVVRRSTCSASSRELRYPIIMATRCPLSEPAPDFDSRPEAIRRAIETRIIEGKMQPGDRLGLKADLQKEFDVAGPTIAQALTLLTNDGLISMRRGPGGGIFVERSRPVIRVGTRRLATGTAQSLAENIETRSG